MEFQKIKNKMVRIDKYGLGAAIGSASKTLADKDVTKYVTGEFDELAVQIARKNLEIQAKTIESIKNNPIKDVNIDATLLY